MSRGFGNLQRAIITRLMSSDATAFELATSIYQVQEDDLTGAQLHGVRRALRTLQWANAVEAVGEPRESYRGRQMWALTKDEKRRVKKRAETAAQNQLKSIFNG
jgi:hypothetical protein